MKTRLLGIGFFVLALVCCGSENPALQRAKRADKAKGDIFVGVAGPWSKPVGAKLWAGIDLAVDEINAEGGVLQRRLRILKQDDDDTVGKGLAVAQFFADNKDVSVLGPYVERFIAPSLPQTLAHGGRNPVQLAQTPDDDIPSRGVSRDRQAGAGHLPDVGPQFLAGQLGTGRRVGRHDN